MKPIKICLLALLLTSLIICTSATAQPAEDIDWLDAEEYTLYWGEDINVSGYSIKAVEFSRSRPVDIPNDYVMLSVQGNGSDSWSAILSVNNSNIQDTEVFDNKLKIKAVDIVTGNDISTPNATIEVSLAKLDPSTIHNESWINTTIEVKKSASKEIYINERFHVTIEVENLKGIDFANVTIDETLPEQFIFDPDRDVDWTFDLPAYDKKILRYSMKSLKPGNFTLPPTEVSLTHLGVTHYKYTNLSHLIIHGPHIIVTKNVSSNKVGLSDMIDVSIAVRNEGDRAAHIEVIDEIPPGTKGIENEFSGTSVIKPSEEYNLNYSIRMNETGDFVIPAARVELTDARGYENTVESKRHLVTVMDGQRRSDESAQMYADDGSNDKNEHIESTSDEEKQNYLGYLKDLAGRISGYVGNLISRD